MAPREHAPKRRVLTETVEVTVGYEQTCAVCGERFESRRPAETCSEACKQRRKRRRAARRAA